MKKISVVTFCLLSLFFVICANAKTKEDRSVPTQYFEDPRYEAVSLFIKNNQYGFGEIVLSEQDNNNLVFLVSVVDDASHEKGLFSVQDDNWRLSVILNGVANTYEVTYNDQEGVGFVKQETSELTELESLAILSMSSTGFNWCSYTSYHGYSLGCWAFDNIWGDYYINTYREGDEITPFHVEWRADYSGSMVMCPVNEYTVANSLPICGPPPL